MSKKFNGHRCERRNLTDLVLGTGPTGKKRAKPKAKKRPKNYTTEPAVNRMNLGGDPPPINVADPRPSVLPMYESPETLPSSTTQVAMPGMPQPVLDQSMIPDVTMRVRSAEEEEIYRDQLRRYMNARQQVSEKEYGGVPKAELGLATGDITGLGNLFYMLEQQRNQSQQGMRPTVRDLSYEPEYQMNMGSQEPGDPSDPTFTGANTRTPFDPSGLLKFAGKLGQKNALKGLSAAQLPGAMVDFNKKMGKLNLAGTAMGSLGSFLNQQAQGESGPMDQFRYNAPDGTMATAGDILSGAGRFAQFGPAGMIGGAVYGAIAGKKRREQAAEDWQTGFDERQDALAAANVQSAYSGADAAYSGYADEGNFYMAMGGRPDYETEKNEVILASPGDKPIAMTGNSYKQLSTNLFKGRGPSHEHGGIPTKGATEPFVDSGGNYQDSPYVFSDAYKIDPTEFLSMLS
jgi:hypothetical protein